MTAIFRVNQVEVTNRLDELGWSRDQLLEIVSAMVAARHSCTDNDPSSAPGWMSWKSGTRRLREIARPMGLEKDETDQIPSVIDFRRGLKFVVVNTDDGTALRHPSMPQNRSKKGPATDRVVSENQGSLFDLFDPPAKVIPLSALQKQPGLIVSWYLCVYCEGDDVRAELSCPVAYDGGYFSDFFERIVLIGPDDGGGMVNRRRDEPDGETEFDIPVSRK